ncbi:MAG TPA: VOC family protein [Pyrinomonadaceae bacterium]|jgi:PhnB protein|nr:VOC family protein [Pyrinomonadaceae bacterium]
MTNTYKPENYHTLTPYLVCKGAAEAIDFYKCAFDARELYRLEYPKGGVGHAEIMIGDSPLMLADEHPDMGFLSPLSTGNSPVGMHLYVPDADAFFARAIAAGAKEIKPVTEQFYGDRAGQVEDPFGYRWHVATAAKQTSPEEMLKLWNKMMEESE